MSWTPDRDAALALLHEYTKGESLRRHAYAVDAAVRGYARRMGEDEALWGVTALLHDFDYERWPSLEEHPYRGVEILQQHGYPEIVTRAILSHADYSGVSRDSALEKVLYACDEMSERGAALIALPLEQHIANVIEALRDEADLLGLRGA